MKLGFVILHYKTLDMTKKCIDVIFERQLSSDYEIVVVDNGSGNGSGESLQDTYADSSHITFLLNKTNLGFANGNNLGFSYAKNTLNCDFICVMNNDVLILQDYFDEKIYQEFDSSGFAVLGPHIEIGGGGENVMRYDLPSYEELIKQLDFNRRRLCRYKSRLWRFYCIQDYWKRQARIVLGKLHILPEIKKPSKKVEGAYEYHTDIVLSGCCLIFSPVYIGKFDDAFDPRTFLFREEELLYIRCKSENMKIVYNPDLRILHLGDVSTDSVYKTKREREIFSLENQIASMSILIKEYDKML